MANPNIVSPAFSQVPRRSGTVKTGFKPLSGRWVTKEISGLVAAPLAGQGNVYLCLEGLQKVAEAATYDPTSNLPSKVVDLPSAVAANEVALAHGIFVFEVGKNGIAPSVLAAAAGAPLYVTVAANTGGQDGFGGVLTDVDPGSGVVVAVLEKVSGTIATIRTVANA